MQAVDHKLQLLSINVLCFKSRGYNNYILKGGFMETHKQSVLRHFRSQYVNAVPTTTTSHNPYSSKFIYFLGLTLLASMAIILHAANARAAWVDTYSGSYDLTCQQASITAQLDIGGGIGAQGSSHSFPLSIELSCNRDDPEFLNELGQVKMQLADACENMTQGLYSQCAEASESYASALYDINAALIDMTPSQADLKVFNATNWANIIWNIYPFNGTIMNDHGSPEPVNFLINKYGQFGAAGLQVFGGDGVGNSEAGLGCIAWATGSVNGSINANNAYLMNAHYALNANLTCGAANQNAAWFLVNMNVGVSGSVSGPKLP